MDAFDINKILQEQFKPRQEFKTPLIQKINPVMVSPDFVPDIHTIKVIPSQSSFPWDEVVILSGAVILIIILINEVRKNQRYIRNKDSRNNPESIHVNNNPK